MKKNIIILVIFLAVVVGVLISWSLIRQSKSEQTKTSPTPFTQKMSPVPTTTPIPTTPPQKYSSSKEKLISLAPVKGDGFTIEYLSSQNAFIILIQPPDREKNKQAAITWLKNHGISDWQNLDITWGGKRGF